MKIIKFLLSYFVLSTISCNVRPGDWITKTRQVTLTFNSKTTDILDCENLLLSSLEIPDEAVLNGETLTILGAFKSTDTFLTITELNGGGDYTINLFQNKHIPVNPFDFAGYNYLKFYCSSDVDGETIKATLRRFE